MIRPTTGADVVDLAARLSPGDVAEVEALAGTTPLETLSIGLFVSDECYSGFAPDGELVCMFGISPAGAGVGCVWLLSAPGLSRCARELITRGRVWLDEKQAAYPTLTNVVTADNLPHIRLIRAMGFRFGSTIENYNNTGVSAVPFERRL